MDRKSIFIIAVATLFTIMIWVVADVLHAKSQVEVPVNIQQIIEPLSPDFDNEALKLLP